MLFSTNCCLTSMWTLRTCGSKSQKLTGSFPAKVFGGFSRIFRHGHPPINKGWFESRILSHALRERHSIKNRGVQKIRYDPRPIRPGGFPRRARGGVPFLSEWVLVVAVDQLGVFTLGRLRAARGKSTFSAMISQPGGTQANSCNLTHRIRTTCQFSSSAATVRHCLSHKFRRDDGRCHA